MKDQKKKKGQTLFPDSETAKELIFGRLRGRSGNSPKYGGNSHTQKLINRKIIP